METDRPDVTESAYTVAAGHFQVESDLFKYVRNKNAGTINTSHIFNLGNYKLGLSERSDIQFVIPTYISNVMRDAGTDKIITRNGGFDDVILRFKYNFWGYSGGKTAFAILPFASFPTSSFSSNGIQGGVVFPFALKINESLDLGSQVEMDIVRDGNKKYHPEYLYSITFGKSFSSLFSSFTESVVSYSPWSHHTDIFVNGGIIFSLSKNFNIDAGFYYGVNKGADRTIFTGFSFRF
ncbi:MAG: transporter [Ginsengibacter sp.]